MRNLPHYPTIMQTIKKKSGYPERSSHSNT